MSVSTFEGVIENGQIRIPAGVKLPENAKVYIVIPDRNDVPQPVHIYSPHLAKRGQAADFRMEIIGDKP